MSNTFMKFIDSCVGAIARKVQDEFDESKHPRDKGGKFSSKGNEGRGGGSSTSTSTGRDDILSELYTNGQGVSKKEIRSVLNMLTDNEVDPEDTTTIKNVWEGAGIDPDKKDIKLTQQYLNNYHSKGGGGKEEKSSSRKTSNGRGDDYEEEDVGEELIQVKRAAKAARRFKSSGIDLASAMEDLDIPTEGVPEKYLESVFEGSLSEDPKLLRKAEDYIERYESGELEKEADRLSSEEDGDEDSESEESESGVEDIQK